MMKRVAFTISEKNLKKLEDYSTKFARGTLEGNRSAVLSDLISRYIPSTNRISE